MESAFPVKRPGGRILFVVSDSGIKSSFLRLWQQIHKNRCPHSIVQGIPMSLKAEKLLFVQFCFFYEELLIPEAL